MKSRVVQLEIHVAHGCNLSCVGCTHFSQEGYSGRHTVQSFVSEIAPWSRRLLPKHFLLLGGEPMLNQELSDICVEARRLWPKTNLILVTNGLLFKRHPKLPEVLKANRIHFDVSIHYNSPEYLKQLEEVKLWAAEHSLPIRWRESFRDWSLYYTGAGASARPFNDGNPQASWDICASRWCMQVYNGNLHKCPPMAYLPMHVEKFGGEKWKPYIRKGLSPMCTDKELLEFVHRRAESCCGMCPSKPQPISKPDPMRRVSLL